MKKRTTTNTPYRPIYKVPSPTMHRATTWRRYKVMQNQNLCGFHCGCYG